jgi:elongation factor G
MAFKEGVRRGKPILLEPVMMVEVVLPEEFLGEVLGDLNARRGHIQSMEVRAGAQVVKAHVPLATMFGYVNTLRSLTSGRATYSMEFDHYEPVPANLAEELIAKARG